MITHTMIVSFDQPLSDTDLDQYLADIERAMLDTGFVQSVATRRHISIPGEEAIPALIATAIVQAALADIDALERRSPRPASARSSTTGSRGTRTRSPGRTTNRWHERRFPKGGTSYRRWQRNRPRHGTGVRPERRRGRRARH
jgi:hypothetical protein